MTFASGVTRVRASVTAPRGYVVSGNEPWPREIDVVLEYERPNRRSRETPSTDTMHDAIAKKPIQPVSNATPGGFSDTT